ncbi:hypothetical protein G2469_00019 [Escherichia phage vB_EcoM_G2469]|uniref:Uncharacterized protein n=1 Tax=Escherichia phage vB_EcoM_G2469 TaxID=2502415 RepID=A0A482GDW3_9CAUD|nr:hypothetical protein G2469_00019 [Escherichia phage vB_EcoM_G2469]
MKEKFKEKFLLEIKEKDFETWYRMVKGLTLLFKASLFMLEQPVPDGPLVGKLKK